MLRSSHIGLGLAVTALLAFQLTGCSSSGGGGGSGKGGTTGSGGSSSPGTGGSSSPGTGGSSSPGTGGTSTPGTGGTGGTSAGGTGGTSAGGTAGTSAGGTGGTSAGTGGTSAGGTAGTSAGGTGGTSAGGTGGTAAGGTGGTAAGGSGGTGTPGFGQPTCATTSGGTAIAKNVPCTAADTQLCYKTCGPQSKGVKSETCTASADGGMAYAEMAGCSFDPAGNYACYKVPTAANTVCPAGATAGTYAMPMASAACTVADSCTLCNSLGGLATGQYLDSSSAMKQGFCICVGSKWSCASDTAWPCGTAATSQSNPGCQ